jgi:2-aminomuconate deaminase
MKGIHSDKAPDPVGPYPHSRRVGDVLYLSGVGPRKKGSATIPGVTLDTDGKIVSYDFEVQCHAVFENMKQDFATFNRIYALYFVANQPCRTTVEVNALPTPIAIELKCIATL